MFLFDAHSAVVEFSGDHVEAIDGMSYAFLKGGRMHLIGNATPDRFSSFLTPIRRELI